MAAICMTPRAWQKEASLTIRLVVARFSRPIKVLVTGGAGFIGSAVIRHIINNTQDSVVNLDKLTYAGNLESLAEVAASDRYLFEQVDICNASEVDRLVRLHQPDAIMHLAAESHVDRSITSPASFIQTNIIGTYQLLEVARQYWSAMPEPRKSQFRFHHVSTDEVYGDLSAAASLFDERSEERRVGKECRSRWWLCEEQGSR